MWIDITKELPKPGERVLFVLYNKHFHPSPSIYMGFYIENLYYSDTGIYDNHPLIILNKPEKDPRYAIQEFSHWMPLPAFPDVYRR